MLFVVLAVNDGRHAPAHLAITGCHKRLHFGNFVKRMMLIAA